ncbi:hypothetical protein FEE95_17610 [Maribacter algarum]|uniref:Uncharacterized protein n=1 Tax=Maribacter algarum (ex Zhang et al. 2020) TaxID=2578118 RepID=A0A5S3PHG9_9FLAO|nr:hypothetical protein [Maribacter algarum]TMM53715.1 hypothetical protein FEE95_17610 [Maribacter algarum]
MKSKPNIDQLVEDTLDSVSNINMVKTPPFFKEKVLNRMAEQDVEEVKRVRYLDWFTPRYQAAALVCFVILNAFALLSNNADSGNDENVENFAEVYGFSETTTDSFLYQK